MRWLGVVVLAVAAAVPAQREAAAQTPESQAAAGPRNCTLRVLDPAGVTRREGDLLYIDDPFTVVCDDGANLRARSGIYDRTARLVTLMGDVFFDDPTRSLTSDRAVYNSTLGMLHATGNVVFTDRVEGTTLTGPELEYYRATETRPDALVNAMGRPRLTLRQRPGGADADSAASPSEAPVGAAPADTSGMPLTIDADRMTIEGSNNLTAFGNVVIQDDEMRAVADEAEQRGAAETLELRGNAEIHSREYSLAAAVIFATVPDGSIQDVEATGDARMLGEDLNVEAPRMTLVFADDLLQRSIARSDEALAPGVQPLATSPSFRLQADSIDASLPGQRLQLVVAIGDARGEMIDTTRAAVAEGDSAGLALADSAGVAADSTLAVVDTAAAPAEEGVGRVDRVPGGIPARVAGGDSVTTLTAARLVENDWITGDTITGYFGSVAVTPADSASTVEGDGSGVPNEGDPSPELAPDGELAGLDPAAGGEPADTTLVMERMVAVGNAMSLYHAPPEEGAAPGALRGVNFLSAAKIELQFEDGQVQEADVTGLSRGLYLDPEPVRQADPEGEEVPEAAEGTDAEEPAGEESPEEGAPGGDAPPAEAIPEQPEEAVEPAATPPAAERREENR